MRFSQQIAIMGLGALAMTVAGPAMAQKAKDTVRIAFAQPMNVVDTVFDPRPEASLIARGVYNWLVGFDAETRKFVPQLAESWTRVDPETLEFKLRKDVKFHDGSEFDADDVVYTIKLVINPKINFRFKGSRFGWIKDVVKVDKHTVRIISKGVVSTGLGRLTTQPSIFPSDYHSKFSPPSDFGRKPIGTGPFKVVSVDSTAGAVLERFDDYKLHSKTSPRAQVGKIIVKPLPDAQSRVANMLAGQLDLIYAVDKDQAANMANDPRVTVKIEPTVAFSYVMYDVRDRSGIGVLKDARVREALNRAINKQGIASALVPKSIASQPFQKSMCHPWHIACDFSAESVGYDVAKAKQLLAEAGHPNGFDIEITTWGPSTKIAEAVAGEWRKIGVRAKVDRLTIGAFIKKRAQGRIQANVSLWDNGVGQPDVDTTAGFFWLPGSRNMNGDKALTKAVFDGRKELDVEKRKAIYRAGMDRMTTQQYSMPIVPLPAIVVHNKDLELQGGHKNPKGFEFSRLKWK